MAHRVKEVEREQRSEIKSMRTSESQELGSSVAQEMEKKRKLAELKRLQVLPIRTVALTCGRPADFLFPCYRAHARLFWSGRSALCSAFSERAPLAPLARHVQKLQKKQRP
jgi:hypothetical protein